MTRLALALLLCLPAGRAFAAGAPAPAAAKSGGRMELFLEPMDRTGWQWFFLADMVRRRLDGADLKVYPLLPVNEDGTPASGGGETELAEARRLAVVSKDYPAQTLNYLNARSMNPAADGWRDSALFAGINPDELERRAVSQGGAALGTAAAKASALGVKASALLLDGRPFEGSQRLTSLYNAVNAALPAARRRAAPEGYKPPPKAALPGFWVVLSSGLRVNDALVGVFDRYFEGIKPVVLDYGAPERAAKFSWLEFAPAYVLAATPEAKSKFEAEIKAGLFKENGAFLVYEDRARGGLYAARAARENVLELFVMSQCPYGVMAENSVFESEKNSLLPAGLKLEVHFIGEARKNDKNGWEFSSLHGEAEWQEDARQLFISRRFPEKFAAYLLERNREISSPDWEKAAKAAGVDPAAVAAGFEEAKDLLAGDFAATAGLGITTSPSFLLDGRNFKVGISELSKAPGFEKLPPPGQPGAGSNSK